MPMPHETAEQPSQPGGAFPPTRWTWVSEAKEEETSEVAMNLLCGIYWYPLFAAARFKHGLDYHRAQDITQGFWQWFLEKDFLSRAQPERGKFRNFLMSYFDNFVLHEWRAERAQKRGGGALMISRDGEEWNARYELELGQHQSPEELVDRAWERANLEASFHEVEADWQRRGKGAVFEALKEHIVEGAERGSTKALAQSLGLTEENVRQHLSRLRKDLRAACLRWVGAP